MQFRPIGGFPSIIREEDAKISNKSLESRGFATTNIVSINNIMESKKKENLFIAFGSEEEDGGVDYEMENLFTMRPRKYDKIQ